MTEELEKDNLISDNEIFRQIFFDVKNNMGNSDFDPWKFFIYHHDANISRLATDLLSEKFIESKRWAKSGAYTEKEEDILDFLIPRIIYEYKLRRVKIMLSDIEKLISTASQNNDFERVMEEQSKYMNLKKVEKYLSDNLGNRAII